MPSALTVFLFDVTDLESEIYFFEAVLSLKTQLSPGATEDTRVVFPGSDVDEDTGGGDDLTIRVVNDDSPDIDRVGENTGICFSVSNLGAAVEILEHRGTLVETFPAFRTPNTCFHDLNSNIFWLVQKN